MTVTSTHHQMMRPSKDAIILAVGIDNEGKPLCTERQSFDEQVDGQDGKKYPDIEVVWYPNTKALCFQPHPEFSDAPNECREYFDELLENYVLPLA
jgi:hypothetical protein